MYPQFEHQRFYEEYSASYCKIKNSKMPFMKFKKITAMIKNIERKLDIDVEH